MRRVADLHPGQAKTDARDAYIIADTARTMPHTLRGITIADEHIAELSLLCGFDDDLTSQLTGVRNRLRGLLTQIHPALEQVVGPRLAHPAVVDMLSRYPTPAALHEAGRSRVRTRLKKLAPRMAARLADEIFAALAEQTTIVAGTNTAGHIISRLAAQLAQLTEQRADIEAEILTVVDAHPSNLRPDLYARHRGQDSRAYPHRGRRQELQIRRTPSLIRRYRTGNPPIRNLHSR